MIFFPYFILFSVSSFHVSVSTEIYFASFPLLSPASEFSPNFHKDMDSKDLLSRLAVFIKMRICAQRGQGKGPILEGGRNETPPNFGSTRLHNPKSRTATLR
jgi:hypothetical protein